MSISAFLDASPQVQVSSNRFDAGVCPRRRRRLEQHIVARIRIERRIQVDEVDECVRKLAAHLKIVAVE
jgi:hypothetical protein